MGALKQEVRVPRVKISHTFNKTFQEEQQVLTVICLVLSGKVLVHGNAGISRRWVIFTEMYYMSVYIKDLHAQVF